jgi:hypothetical protein
LPTTKIVRKPGESVVEFTERAMKEDPDWNNGALKALGTSFVKRAKKSDRRRKLEKASRKKNRR